MLLTGEKTKETFYDTSEIGLKRMRSRELDFGVWWWDGQPTLSNQYRVTWIADTGEVYASRFDYAVQGERYRVLGTIPTEEEVERVLQGWAEECGKPESLRWVESRVVRR